MVLTDDIRWQWWRVWRAVCEHNVRCVRTAVQRHAVQRVEVRVHVVEATRRRKQRHGARPPHAPSQQRAHPRPVQRTGQQRRLRAALRPHHLSASTHTPLVTSHTYTHRSLRPANRAAAPSPRLAPTTPPLCINTHTACYISHVHTPLVTSSAPASNAGSAPRSDHTTSLHPHIYRSLCPVHQPAVPAPHRAPTTPPLCIHTYTARYVQRTSQQCQFRAALRLHHLSASTHTPLVTSSAPGSSASSASRSNHTTSLHSHIYRSLRPAHQPAVPAPRRAPTTPPLCIHTYTACYISHVHTPLVTSSVPASSAGSEPRSDHTTSLHPHIHRSLRPAHQPAVPAPRRAPTTPPLCIHTIHRSLRPAHQPAVPAPRRAPTTPPLCINTHTACYISHVHTPLVKSSAPASSAGSVPRSEYTTSLHQHTHRLLHLTRTHTARYVQRTGQQRRLRTALRPHHLSASTHIPLVTSSAPARSASSAPRSNHLCIHTYTAVRAPASSASSAPRPTTPPLCIPTYTARYVQRTSQQCQLRAALRPHHLSASTHTPLVTSSAPASSAGSAPRSDHTTSLHPHIHRSLRPAHQLEVQHALHKK
ncbi:unnamed protein product [Parnassius apollo]|uniref:(apollo) hypothetical protein n=1 Tax=Parnassius apollo TaxID=110799 RepID=A0A8S3XD25_PARAO|nr:unnamed protein product [Parnassius apollo]